MTKFMMTFRGSGEIPKKLSESIHKPAHRKNRQELKVAIELIKSTLKEETDQECRLILAEAGLMLNSIFVRKLDYK